LTQLVSGTIKRVTTAAFGAFVLASCSVISAQETTETAALSAAPKLDRSDRNIARKNRQSALENSASGKPLRWKNPSSGTRGSVTPLKTWQTAKGKYCRSYREWIKLSSGQSLNRRGSACRAANAVWKSA
jgi:surface antigen